MTTTQTMTDSAAKGFGRQAARTQFKAHGATIEDCTTELEAFRGQYGYEHSEAFVQGYWAECLALEYPDFVA